MILLLTATLIISGSLVFVIIGQNKLLRVNNGMSEGENSTAVKKVHQSPVLFKDPVQIGDCDIFRSAAYKNLQVYVLKGDVFATERNYVTLQHALRNTMVNVEETGTVNELKIDNNSKEYIYINSGDIVKGGQQDRTIQYDVIIPPQKQDVDLASFCVEHGRWSQRENENVMAFTTSENSLSSKELKIAAKHLKSQDEVWKNVDKYQEKANRELKKATADSAAIEVKSDLSASSLELTLDNKYINQSREDYKRELTSQLKEITGATGLAYCINGKLYSIELFNNPQLFADMYDKLLEAAITEAISEEVSDKEYALSPGLNKIFEAKANVYEDIDVNELTRFRSSEPDGSTRWIIFTTVDKGINKWLHRNWLDKTED